MVGSGSGSGSSGREGTFLFCHPTNKAQGRGLSLCSLQCLASWRLLPAGCLMEYTKNPLMCSGVVPARELDCVIVFFENAYIPGIQKPV